jgi:hypothetical protein
MEEEKVNSSFALNTGKRPPFGAAFLLDAPVSKPSND